MKFKFYAFKLSGIIILVFLAQLFIPGFTDMFVLNSDAWIEVWRFFSAVFLHGGVGHLAYNLFALVLFGSILESLIGGRRFLIVFFVTGVLANIVAVNFYSSSLGASGAIFGVIGALIILRPLMPIWAFGLPMPIFLAGIVWVVGDAIGIFIPDGVGNIAHLSGLGFGLVLGYLYRKNVGVQKKQKKGKVILDERRMRRWEDYYLR